METELKLFTVCPECGGRGIKRETQEGYEVCPSEYCNQGYVPWTPKAAPLVWEKFTPEIWEARINNELYYRIESELNGVFMWSFSGVLHFHRANSFGEAQTDCQSHADALAYKLVTGKEPQ